MFSRVFRAIVGSLLFCGAVHCTPTADPVTVPLPIYLPSFKDQSPYGGALLDINVLTPCVSNLIVEVHLPLTWDPEETTATLVGPSFPAINVDGASYNHPGMVDEPFPTSASVAWDDTTKTLTFSNFIFGGSSSPTTANGQTGWTNINFNIPDADIGIGQLIPLTLAPLKPSSNNLYIRLNSATYFQVTQTNAQCTDTNTHGDPVFAGFQGQNFQFHGLPDEHFNLVSSPNVSVNAHFVYLANGKCDYTDTECWTHPGTYMDVLGMSLADSRIKVAAGTHEAGLRVWVDDIELTRGERVSDFNSTGFVHYYRNGRLQIETDIMGFHIVNSDMFMNIKVSLNRPELVRAGAAKHTITDTAVCKANSETSHHQLVESIVAQKYPVITPLHGLIGQTWRNVKVCGHDWMGTTEDYLVSELFANDNHYNYFSW